ncbi:hypothetical protein EDB85DRAFT_781078 [Lactarius pseudohatsudake]|nr:hypothetical protein EDB85DRAFT_781078 [Lactarius pseudohatsudake]
MPGNRAPVELERNVHFVDADNDEIGGLCQNGSVTWAEISEWMQIVYMLPSNQYATFPCLEHGDPEDPVGQHGAPINMQANTDLVQPGYYVVLSPEGLPVEIPINDEGPVPRAATRSLSKVDHRSENFRRLVRERDRHCVVTRTRNFRFIGLEAAHIFPVAHLDLWRSGSWQQHITDDKYDGETGIHSVQNGILLDSTAHIYFGKYLLAINPDNDYKVVCFCDQPRFDGMTMYRNLDVDEKYQPCPALLKHHFRMAVLLNMKARVGYPEWDEDIPEGYDQMAEITLSQQGQLRLETVLAGKLNGLVS